MIKSESINYISQVCVAILANSLNAFKTTAAPKATCLFRSCVHFQRHISNSFLESSRQSAGRLNSFVKLLLPHNWSKILRNVHAARRALNASGPHCAQPLSTREARLKNGFSWWYASLFQPAKVGLVGALVMMQHLLFALFWPLKLTHGKLSWSCKFAFRIKSNCKKNLNKIFKGRFAAFYGVLLLYKRVQQCVSCLVIMT